jgi:radical SAM protein with 4Fe4S-binding SPASM domain
LYVGIEAPNYGSQERDMAHVFCGAGINILNVTPEGNLTPCNSYPTQFGNLKEKSLITILKESKQLQIVKNAIVHEYEQCGTNERCGYCNRCPGQSFIEHGTPFKSSSANCRISNARMNLATKLKNGIDPLQGKSIEENMKSLNIETIRVTSKKTGRNYRNAEIIAHKS